MPFLPKPSPVPPRPSSLGGIFRESLFGSKSIPKPEVRPQAKPQPKSPFETGGKVSTRKLLKEGRMYEMQRKSVIIPDAGGKQMWGREYSKLLQERIIPYQKRTGRSELDISDRKNILRQMREEDKGKGMPSRERRVLEEQWKLRGKY